MVVWRLAWYEQYQGDSAGHFLGRDIDGAYLAGLPFVIDKICEKFIVSAEEGQ